MTPHDHEENPRSFEAALGDGTVPLRRWRCPRCGQLIFTQVGDPPPDLCDYCRDMTTWQPVT